MDLLRRSGDNGGCLPRALPLTPAQLAYLAGLKRGPAAITGRVEQRIASSLAARGLVHIDEATAPGEPDTVAILSAGLAALVSPEAPNRRQT